MRARHLALVTLAALLSAACSFQGLAFRVDDRLTFVEPEDREEVRLPVTIDWTIEDFEVAADASEGARGDAGYFGVFIDRSPQPPGEPLEWFARDDEPCVQDPECPDVEYFSARGIHTTTDTEFTIDAIPRPPDSAGDRRELHEVTVILLDPNGRRIGESAWTVEFQVDRSPTP